MNYHFDYDNLACFFYAKIAIINHMSEFTGSGCGEKQVSDVVISEFEESRISELLSFLKEWGSDHPELGEGEILRWQKCFRFIAEYRNRIVGYIGQIPHDFIYGKKSTNNGIEHIGWGITLVLDLSNDRIRKQAGRGLLSRCENNNPYRFSGVGIVPAIEEPYKRRGYNIRRDCCSMFARFVKPLKALKYLRKPIYLSPLITGANLIFGARNKTEYKNIEKIDRFKPEWDKYWERILSEEYELFGLRNAEYLNYKLSQPYKRYFSYVQGDEGYIIFRLAEHRVKDLKLIKICDLVGTEAAKMNLLALPTQYLRKSSAYGIVALSSQSDRRIFRKAGLFISKPYPIALPKTIDTKIHISFFDSDLDDLW